MLWEIQRCKNFLKVDMLWAKKLWNWKLLYLSILSDVKSQQRIIERGGGMTTTHHHTLADQMDHEFVYKKKRKGNLITCCLQYSVIRTLFCKTWKIRNVSLWISHFSIFVYNQQSDAINVISLDFKSSQPLYKWIWHVHNLLLRFIVDIY